METGPVDPALPVRPATVVEVERTVVALPAPTLGDRIQELRYRVEEEARKDPVKVLAIAIGAGWLCGKILHAVLSRPKPRRRRVEADVDIDLD